MRELPNKEILAGLANAIAQFDNEGADDIVSKAVAMKIPAYEIVMDGLSPGLQEVGRKYEEGEYFLSELILAAEVARSVLETLKPHFQAGNPARTGRVVIGTVEGDLHDIGKNLVVVLAEASGLEVHDLGVDVLPEKFMEHAKKLEPDVLGMSSLLSTTVPKFKETVDKLKKEGLRQRIKIIIGGVSATPTIADQYGIDAYEPDAVAGVRRISKWMTTPAETLHT